MNEIDSSNQESVGKRRKKVACARETIVKHGGKKKRGIKKTVTNKKV
jgi:hypothetical protein